MLKWLFVVVYVEVVVVFVVDVDVVVVVVVVDVDVVVVLLFRMLKWMLKCTAFEVFIGSFCRPDLLKRGPCMLSKEFFGLVFLEQHIHVASLVVNPAPFLFLLSFNSDSV